MPPRKRSAVGSARAAVRRAAPRPASPEAVERLNPATIEAAVALGATRPLRIERPVVASSGPLGFGAEAGESIDLRTIGLFVARGASLAPRRGGPAPRLVEVPGGLLHAIGRENPGIDEVVERHGAAWRDAPCAVALSLVAGDERALVRLVERLERRAETLGLVAYELDATVGAEALDGARWESGTEALLSAIVAVRDATDRHLIVKVSPQATAIASLADSLADAGGDTLSVSGSPRGFLPDRRRRRAALAAGIGELSGPLIRPLALAAVAEVAPIARAAGIGLIGGGGVGSPADALDLLAAGAQAVALGSALWADPGLPAAVTEGARRAAAARGYGVIGALSGAALGSRR